jgi:hypothetical protein
VDATLRWSGVETECSPNAIEAHRILLDPSHQEGSPRSTMGPSRAVTEPMQARGILHNLIGGSQVIATKYHKVTNP